MGGAERKESPEWMDFLSFGIFVMLLGFIWASTPNLGNEAIDFFKDLHMAEFSKDVFLPAPTHNHPVLYKAAANFALLFGAFQMVILGLKILLGDSFGGKIDAISGIVFWLVLSLLLNMLANGSIGWFSFIGGFLICIGLAIVLGAGLSYLGLSLKAIR